MSDQARRRAMRLARRLGCSGAHQHDDGTWMPCASHDEMVARTAESKSHDHDHDDKDGDCGCGGPCCDEAKRERQGQGHRKRWERLRERGVRGIDTLDGGGLVSGKGVEASERVVFDDTEAKAKRRKPRPAPSWDYFARDGDMDGLVQDGTSHERRSRTFTHRTIGRRKKPTTRTRLRDLPFPYGPTSEVLPDERGKSGGLPAPPLEEGN
jgi:hypothetical protein